MRQTHDPSQAQTAALVGQVPVQDAAIQYGNPWACLLGLPDWALFSNVEPPAGPAAALPATALDYERLAEALADSGHPAHKTWR